MKKWILIVLASIVGLIALLFVVGLFVPRGHEASRSIVVHRGIDEAWVLVADLPGRKAWRSDLKGIERLPDVDGKPVWCEDSSWGKLTYAIEESTPPSRFVTEICDPELPYSGSWTWELAAVEGGTRVTITERGEIKNALFRTMSRFVLGYTMAIDGVLKDLGRKFGEDVKPS